MFIIGGRRRHRVACLWFLRLALLVPLAALFPEAARADLIEVDITHYLAHVGDPHANYFNGKLLTENDLSGDQSYKHSSNRYIGETEKDLSELFLDTGFADVVLLFDEADALFGNRTDVKDSHDRFADDFIVLDPETGTWRGRLYLEENGDIVPGVYDDLSGTFHDLVVVAAVEPAGLSALGLVALAALRRRARMRR